jgi:peptide/bleomycin uptake transporter
VLILFATWYKVELDVKINEWFGDFYNLIQKALSQSDSIRTSIWGSWPLSVI